MSIKPREGEPHPLPERVREQDVNKMNARMMRRGSGVIGFVVIGLTVLAFGMPGGGAPASSNDAWAVIFATGHDGQVQEGWALHNWLLQHGWQDSHIKFLAECTMSDGAPTKDNIHSAISWIAANSNSNSLVFISALDDHQWGDGHLYYHASDGLISEVELGNWVNETTAYGKMGIEVSGRYTAACIPNLSGQNRVVVTSHAATEDYAPNNYRLSVAFQMSYADVDNDGYVSLQEAHNYEYNFIQQHFPGTQTPQMQDDAGPLILDVYLPPPPHF